jgi:hypothetical protein
MGSVKEIEEAVLKLSAAEAAPVAGAGAPFAGAARSEISSLILH